MPAYQEGFECQLELILRQWGAIEDSQEEEVTL